MRATHLELRSAALINALRACQLFGGLPLGDLQQIAAFTTSRQLNAGAYLFRESDPAEGVYVVQRGAINVHRVSSAGKEQVIQIFRPGQSFAEAALADDSGYPADARAIEDTTVLLLPKGAFLGLLRLRPDLAVRMLGSMSQHLRVLVRLLDDLTLKDVETRLANWLLKRCPNPGSREPVTIELDRTKRILAAEIGTISETLSRTFAAFRSRDLIRVRGKIITILDPSGLRDLLRRNLGEL